MASPTLQATDLKPFFTASLPLPIGVNHMYQIVAFGQHHRIALTDDAAQWKQDAAVLLTQADHDWSKINAIRSAKIKVPLAVELFFYVKDLWKSDVDGRIKPAVDAVFRHLELNDHLVVLVQASKEKSDDPRVEIAVRCLLSGRG